VRHEPEEAAPKVVRPLVGAMFVEGSEVSTTSAKGCSNGKKVMLGNAIVVIVAELGEAREPAGVRGLYDSVPKREGVAPAVLVRAREEEKGVGWLMALVGRWASATQCSNRRQR
jgi:hypothetical protein